MQNANGRLDSFAAKPQGEPRPYETMIILGPSGFGKSALADELSESYRAAGGREWVIDPMGNWPGHPGQFRYTNARDLDEHLHRLKSAGPGRIIFDDADLYYRHPTDARMEIVVGNRHMQKDVILIARRPQGLHKDFFQIASSMALFHMRQQYAREYIENEFEVPGITRKIPREKFRYLYVHRETGAMKVYATRPRATITASDLR